MQYSRDSFNLIDTDLNFQEWYWPDTTREEVNRCMNNKPDGYFMVRDSSDKSMARYTLTVRKGEQNKLLRIKNRNGLYGFCEPCKFGSVSELIKYHHVHNLSELNDQLNLTLEYPCKRPTAEINNGDCYYQCNNKGTVNVWREIYLSVYKNGIYNDNGELEFEEFKQQTIKSWSFDQHDFNNERFGSAADENRHIDRKSNWFIENITRAESVIKLSGRQHGTFLIRKGSEKNTFTLDIMVNDDIQHCRILCHKERYGFIEGGCIYKSLKDLVKTFHVESLERYNKYLTTTLAFPVNCENSIGERK